MITIYHPNLPETREAVLVIAFMFQIRHTPASSEGRICATSYCDEPLGNQLINSALIVS